MKEGIYNDAEEEEHSGRRALSVKTLRQDWAVWRIGSKPGRQGYIKWLESVGGWIHRRRLKPNYRTLQTE